MGFNQRPDTVRATEELLNHIRLLKETGLFAYVEPDYIQQALLAPSDARFADDTLWGLRNTGTDGGVAGADIDALRAWDLTTGSREVIVAIIDSGIRYTHKELAGQMWRNPGEIPGNGIDEDQDGYVDNIFGIDATTDSGDPFDRNNHGTHLAGNIGAAANDGRPHVGVAWQVQLMACKFLTSDGFGFTTDAIQCIDFAVTKGVRIINASWGGGPFANSLFDAIRAARDQGVLFVTGAGNFRNDNDAFPHYPASYPLDNIIAVAALDRRDRLGAFSSFGRTSVHLGAPGVEIYSATAVSDTAYGILEGTSMAASYVSGVAALILGRDRSASLIEVRNRLLTGVTVVPELSGKVQSGGRLNAFRALTLQPDGVLEVAVSPAAGSDLLAGSTMAFQVTVTDVAGVANASIRGWAAGLSEELVFRDDGRPPDDRAGDTTYTANVNIPKTDDSLNLAVHITAPGKTNFIETVVYSVVSPPANDNFENATVISPHGGLLLANNKLATLEEFEPNHARAASAAASVWWRWSPARSSGVLMDTAGSSFDTLLAVYANTQWSTLGEVASADDIPGRKQGYVRFDAIAGTEYYIAVAGASAREAGSIRLRVEPDGEPDHLAPRLAVTSPLSGFTVTNALSNTITITGTAEDPQPNGSGVREVLVRINDRLAHPAHGTMNWAATNTLETGHNTIQVVAVDYAGNVSPTRSLTVTYRPMLLPNDLFAEAVELLGREGTVKADSGGASKEFGEPSHGGNAGGKSVWWLFRPTADGVLSLTTEPSSFNTVLGLYTGDRVTNLTEIASNDDASPGNRHSQLSQALKSFQACRIAVDGRDGESGPIQLRFAFQRAPVHSLMVSSTLGGRVTPRSGYFRRGDSVEVLAWPAENYFFERWEGSLKSYENPLRVTLDRDLSLTAIFLAHDFTEGFESGDLKKRSWVSSDTLPWQVQEQTVALGRFAARSGPIQHGQRSSLILTELCRDGIGAFQLRVSSESGWDNLEFFLNGQLSGRWSGEVDWLRFSFPVRAGLNTFEWRYSKDIAGLNLGLDAAFLDNLQLPLLVPADRSAPARLVLERLGADGARLHLLGQADQEYVIQSSENLAQWLPISTNVASHGIIRFVDPTGARVSKRFYRAIVP